MISWLLGFLSKYRNQALTLFQLENLQAYSDWLYNVPWGMYKALMYIKEHYGNPTVMLSENGRLLILVF